MTCDPELQKAIDACHEFRVGIDTMVDALRPIGAAFNLSTQALEEYAAAISGPLNLTFDDLEWMLMSKGKRRRWCLRLAREAKFRR